MSDVRFRNFRNSDSKVLEDIIRKTWHFDDYTSRKTAELGARIYLLSCLANQTYTCVAEKDGIPLGIIMINNLLLPKVNIKYKFLMLKSVLSFTFKRDRKYLSEWRELSDETDELLLNASGKKYDAELQFLQ